MIGGSLALFAWRAPRVGLGGGFAPVSRESLLLANNVLLTVAMAAVMLGTLYPLFLDALDLGKISVGPPYFDTVFFPLMAPAVFLMAVGPVASWKRAALPELWTRLRWALARRRRGGARRCRSRSGTFVAAGRLRASGSRVWVVAATVVAASRSACATAPQATLGAQAARAAALAGTA